MRETLIDRSPVVVGITIPASTESTIANCKLQTLVEAALRALLIDPEKLEWDWFTIPGETNAGAGTTRGGFNVCYFHANETAAVAAFGTKSIGIPDGEAWEPAHTKYRGAYVRSQATAIAATVVLH